jgi:alkaline phosphatase
MASSHAERKSVMGTRNSAGGVAVRLVLALCLSAVLITPATALAAQAKNVIVLIVDGCSAEQYTFARWYKGAPLSFDPHRVGSVKTYIADSVIADSAPAASAFATGVRTSDKHISVGPHRRTLTGVPVPSEDLQYRPFATVLEGARLLGKATGIVATSRVTHATPGAYLAHTASRSSEDDIMEQAVHQGVDVVLGGGRQHLLPKGSTGGVRADGENLYQTVKGWGYAVPETRAELHSIKQGRVFGLFADDHMDPEIDRPNRHPDQPTLAEMTLKAIELLAQDRDGFFLMVEGSQVDWACHANDVPHMLSDLLAYDQAVEAALAFAKRNGRTLVLAVSDHNTGGFSIGNHNSNKMYSQMKVEDLLEPFRRMKVSGYHLWRALPEKSSGALRAALREGWGMDITDAEARRIVALAPSYGENAYNALGEVLCPIYTHVGWTTHGHCGGDVPLHAFGPGRPSGGVIDAPEIARICASAMGLDLEKLNRRLFVDAAQAFPGRVAVDLGQPANPVVKIATTAGLTAELPVNKNFLRLGEKVYPLEGVVVYAKETGRAYIPQQAVGLIQGTRGLPKIAP